MNECPPVQDLERLVEGSLDPEAAAAARAHIDHCSACQEAVRHIKQDAALLSDVRRIVNDAAGAILALASLDSAGAPPCETRIAGFELVRLIGEGATAAVYEAFQPMPRRQVAVKLLRNWETASAARRELFEREAHALARLSHPNIAIVFAAGLSETGQPYIAMELVRGTPLHRHWTESGLDVRARVELIAAVCDAVQHAHDRGVLHRDLKPSNVLVNQAGQVKVLDFGLARIGAPEGSRPDEPGDERTLYAGPAGLLGTLAFMAPEQVRGDAARIDHRCDVYALGSMLHFALTDQTPIPLAGLSVREAAAAVCERAPEPPSRAAGRPPDALDRIVARAMAKRPEDRYPSAAELAAALRAWLGGRTPEPVVRRGSITAVSVLGGLLLVILLVRGIWGGWWGGRDQHPPEAPAAPERPASERRPLSLAPGWVLEKEPPEELAALTGLLSAATSEQARRDLLGRVGLLHEAMGDHPAAEARFAELLRLEGDQPTPQALCRWARAATELGKHAEAEASLDRARLLVRRLGEQEMLPERLEMTLSSVLLCSKTGRQDEAEGQVRRARRLRNQLTSPQHREWADWLGMRVGMDHLGLPAGPDGRPRPGD